MGLFSLHKNVKIRILDVFMNGLSSSMYFPFMAIYFASRFGDELTGILMIFTVILGFSAGLYAGYYSDLIGRKKILLGAALARFIGVLIMILANSPTYQSTILTFIAILIISACAGISEPVAEAMVIDVTTNENRKTVYNFMYWFRNLSQVIGAVIGGFLFTTHLFWILIISSILSLLSVCMIHFFIIDEYKSKEELKQNSILGVLKEMGIRYKNVSMDRKFMIFTLATLLFFTLEFQISNYIGIRLSKEMELQNLLSLGSYHLTVDGTRMLGILNAENTFLVVTVTLIIGKIVQRFNGFKVLVFGLCIYTAGYFILGFSNAPYILIMAAFIATIGEIMFWPIRQAYLADLVPENARSSYMAVNSLVFRGSSIIASLFITIGAFVSPIVISFLYIVIGLCSIWLFKMSISQINYQSEKEMNSSM